MGVELSTEQTSLWKPTANLNTRYPFRSFEACGTLRVTMAITNPQPGPSPNYVNSNPALKI